MSSPSFFFFFLTSCVCVFPSSLLSFSVSRSSESYLQIYQREDISPDGSINEEVVRTARQELKKKEGSLNALHKHQENDDDDEDIFAVGSEDEEEEEGKRDEDDKDSETKEETNGEAEATKKRVRKEEEEEEAG